MSLPVDLHVAFSTSKMLYPTLDRPYAALDEFFKDETTRYGNKALLLQYLAEKPSFFKPADIVTVGEIKTRLDIEQDIKFIHKYYS